MKMYITLTIQRKLSMFPIERDLLYVHTSSKAPQKPLYIKFVGFSL